MIQSYYRQFFNKLNEACVSYVIIGQLDASLRNVKLRLFIVQMHTNPLRESHSGIEIEKEAIL